MAQTDIPDAERKIGTRDKDVPWYNPDIGNKLSPSARELLETYSKILSAEVENHVKRIRDQAWEVWPYPCIGGFRFLDLAIGDSPNYPQILQRLKTGNENFLDLGCCFGQEIRRLVADGAPSEKLYGSDLRPEFFELGYEFFGDRDKLQSKFIAADIFDPDSGLKELEGKIDILYAGSFLHLFGYEKQLEVCIRIAGLLREKEGSLLVGRQVGHVNAGERTHRTNPDQRIEDKQKLTQANSRFRQSEGSFTKMWETVGEKTGSKWKVNVKVEEIDETDRNMRPNDQDEGLRRLRFSVFRL
ncbi:uncharacterized protein LY89DRAFT_709008 [Mollisia scopiformis]|uniref:Methyltransferase domain-containing protein n=1 Tax=Mollisia scopiformis TaxID=149040 RepID=A0A194X183_MOLSC|nr:uncharacterized protein LY89DRAFT_709008 [Mollisia scopiformis]KUJ13956.1 hypothetical protein LY89DRAFT_709008 [Mollisia scopiformis]